MVKSKENVTRVFMEILSAIIGMVICLTTISTTISAAETRGAGGYAQRTYTAVAVNEVFTLTPTSYVSSAKKTIEI